MSDQAEREFTSFCISPGQDFNFPSLQTPVFFSLIWIFWVQHHTKTHLGTHSLCQHVCFLSKPRSLVLQISPPDNSDNPGTARPSAEQIISLLRQAHSAAECKSASICVCYMMTLIGKTICGPLLPAWPYQICTWTRRLCVWDSEESENKKKTTSRRESCCLLCSIYYLFYSKCVGCLHGEERELFCPLVAMLHITEGSPGPYRLGRWFFSLRIPPCWLRWVGLSCRTRVRVWLQMRGASCPEVLGMQQQYRHRHPDEKSSASKEEKFTGYFVFLLCFSFWKSQIGGYKRQEEKCGHIFCSLLNTVLSRKEIRLNFKKWLDFRCKWASEELFTS